MECMPAIEMVLEGIDAAFKSYGATSTIFSTTKEATDWLEKFQNSIFAWDLSDKLLRMNRDETTSYFGAHTIRTKIQFALHELPHESYKILRESLLKYCTAVDFGPVLTQLCLALADAYLQITQWNLSLSGLIQEFGNNDLRTFLVEFLRVFPEEVNSRHLRIGDNRRIEMINEISQTSPLLMEFLVKRIESGDCEMQERILNCLSNWMITYSVPEECLIESKLLLFPFKILSTIDAPIRLHRAATECICSALIAVEELGNSKLAHFLFHGVMNLHDEYCLLFTMQDLGRCMNYCKIFTEMAESFMKPIIKTPNQGFGDLRTLELLLMCIGHHNYEVADVTFNFWNRFSEILYNRSSVKISIFRPYVQRLVVALLKLCQYESELDGVPEHSDDFEEFRRRCVEIIKDTEYILGATSVVVELIENLKGEGANSSWVVAEAKLLVIGALGKYVDRKEMCAVPQLLQMIISQPPESHLAMLQSSIRLIGEFSIWISFHPEFLEPCLAFLMRGIHRLKLSTSAADSIQKLCSQCAEHMLSQFSSLCDIVRSVDSLDIPLQACHNLIKASVLVVCHQPSQNTVDGFKQLCGLQVEPLNRILNLDDVKVYRDDKLTDPIVWLDRLSVIFRCTRLEVPEGLVHPFRDIIIEVLILLCRCFQKFATNLKIIAHCCICISYAVQCLGKTSCDLLDSMVTQMVALYQDHRHPHFLYLGSVLINEFANESSYVPLLFNMFEVLCVSAFKMLKECSSPLTNLDTVSYLFQLNLRCLQKMPIAFLQNPIAKNILLHGIASLSIHHRDANESVTKYLMEFITFANDRPENQDFSIRRSIILELLNIYGSDLVRAVVKAAIDLPDSLIRNSAKVLYELLLVDKSWVSQWLHVQLQSLPSHNTGGTITTNSQQLEAIFNSITNAVKWKAVYHSFRDLGRLFH